MYVPNKSLEKYIASNLEQYIITKLQKSKKD